MLTIPCEFKQDLKLGVVVEVILMLQHWEVLHFYDQGQGTLTHLQFQI